MMEELSEKSIVWDIEDIYNYMEPGLVWVLEKKIEETFEVTKD